MIGQKLIKSLDFKIIKDDPSIGMINKFINLFL